MFLDNAKIKPRGRSPRSFAPAKLLIRPKARKREVSAERQAPKPQTDGAGEPQHRLWKLTAEAVQPKLVRFELIMLFLFLILAAAVSVACFLELSHLVMTNAMRPAKTWGSVDGGVHSRFG
jgi:hypothetical protein